MSDYYISCKVVIIGEGGVGKLEILPNSTSMVTGANFISHILEVEKNQYVKFEIWDTAGEEKYRSLAGVFYKNVSACILVYDITSKPSFNELKNYWIKEIKEYCSKDVGN